MNLTPQDEHYVRAAEGWLDLDEAMEASQELEAISIENRSHPAVLVQYCRLYLDTHRPDYTHFIATSLTEHSPELPDGWFYLACAHARLNRKKEALPALEKCFAAAALGKCEEEWRMRAIEARDLEVVWCQSHKE